MESIVFKLTNENDGTTRRVVFNHGNPPWNVLSEKISTLYPDIPLEKLAVCYTDADEDVVTLSTNEELQDYYNTVHKSGAVIKFSIQDLGSSRTSSDKPLPHTPRSGGRNTFGTGSGLPFDLDNDWEIPNFPNMFIPTSTDDLPHGFVESVPSDASSEAHEAQSASSHSSGSVTPPAPTADKGKGRAADLLSSSVSSASSTASLLAGVSSPPKHSIHVYDISPLQPDKAATKSKASSLAGTHSTLRPTPMESTPRPTVKDIDTASAPASVKAANEAEAGEAAPDPPLPEITPSSQGENASLSNDVASVLTTLTNVISSHPELSESLRNIVHNAANGTYWAAHRDAVHRAADETAQSTGRTAADIQSAEAEAGRRVSEALGNVFQAIARIIPSSARSESASDASGQTTRPWPGSANAPFSTTYWYGQPRWGGNPFTPFSGAPFLHPPPPRFGRHGPGGPRGPPPPPPPPGHDQQPPGGNMGIPPGPPNITMPPAPGNGSHPPPPPPPPPPRGWGSDLWGPPPPTGPRGPPKPTPQELRANVEAAKLLYKTEKERYRQGREEQKREKERRQNAIAAAYSEALRDEEDKRRRRSSNPPAMQLVSNARGPYPQLEMFSVPRRHNTTGHMNAPPAGRRRGPEPPVEDPVTRSFNRIKRSLADMGFTESGYPDLPSKIKTALPNSPISKEREDNITTTLLEELIAAPKPAPVASGSGAKETTDIPGAWN